jgi:LAO/AO transport system kinase
MSDFGDAEQAVLAQQLLDRDKRALARAITLVERDEPLGREVVRAVHPHTGRANVVGFTGPPGVGKSTLLRALTKLERARDNSVSVLAVDPSSPFTNGALLGDRVRLSEHFLDPGVFIRSMASRGVAGGLSAAASQAIGLMDAAGADVVLVETVGVGQGEIDIVDHVDTVVLVLMPGSGDAIQALKAGVMEIPDVIVVNKADHQRADAFVRELEGALVIGRHEDDAWRVPVIRTQATSGEGVDQVLGALSAHQESIFASGALVERRARQLRSQVLSLATARVRSRLQLLIEDDPQAILVLERVLSRDLDPASAAAEVLHLYGNTIR